MLQVFNWIKVNVWAVVVVVGLGFLAKFGSDKRTQGRQDIVESINKNNQKVQDDWDKIDRTNPTVDGSLDRLRKRSGSPE